MSAALPPGTYSVTISSPGLKTYVVHDLHLRPGQIYSLPEISLPIARTSADVTVTLTTEELAETELHNELKQRVLGVLPNFYTSYQWNAAPLTANQKLKLTLRAATDPVFLGTTAITAGIEQASNTYPEYGGGPAGYWRRYGAAYGDAVIGRFMGSVVFASRLPPGPALLRDDQRQIWERRSWHAISSTVIQRGDNRHWQPAYAHLLGSATHRRSSRAPTIRARTRESSCSTTRSSASATRRPTTSSASSCCVTWPRTSPATPRASRPRTSAASVRIRAARCTI